MIPSENEHVRSLIAYNKIIRMIPKKIPYAVLEYLSKNKYLSFEYAIHIKFEDIPEVIYSVIKNSSDLAYHYLSINNYTLKKNKVLYLILSKDINYVHDFLYHTGFYNRNIPGILIQSFISKKRFLELYVKKINNDKKLFINMLAKDKRVSL